MSRPPSLPLCCCMLLTPLFWKGETGQVGPSSWVCVLCSHTGPRTLKDLVFGLMLCCQCLEITNNFTRSPTFSFCTRPRKLCSWCCCQGTDPLQEMARGWVPRAEPLPLAITRPIQRTGLIPHLPLLTFPRSPSSEAHLLPTGALSGE